MTPSNQVSETKKEKKKALCLILHLHNTSYFIKAALNHPGPPRLGEQVSSSLRIGELLPWPEFTEVCLIACRFPSHLPAQREQHAAHAAVSLCVHRGQGLHPRCICRCKFCFFSREFENKADLIVLCSLPSSFVCFFFYQRRFE